MKKKICLAYLFMLLASAAIAGQNTATTKATVIMSKTCSIQADDIGFGVLTPGTTTNTDAIGNITILCSSGTSYSYTINYSAADTQANIAHMVGQTYGDAVDFYIANHSGVLFSTSGAGTITGVGTGSWVADTLIAKAYGTPATHSGPIPYVHPDTYSDTINLVLSF